MSLPLTVCCKKLNCELFKAKNEQEVDNDLSVFVLNLQVA